MATHNEHTGDALISKKNTKEYDENYDKIFGKKKSNGGWKYEDAYEQESRLNRIAEGIEQPDSQAPSVKSKVSKTHKKV